MNKICTGLILFLFKLCSVLKNLTLKLTALRSHETAVTVQVDTA